jgi:hypothetical protein
MKVRVPVPVFVTLKFAGAGFAPPWMAPKLRLEGEIERTAELAPGKP